MSATGSVALGLLLAFAAACGVAIGLLLRRERRRFAAQGKARSWARVRLASAAILAITAASVVLPARQVSGMEALAVFYGLLFTLAPLLWFGLHWLAGRSVSPALAPSESMSLALTPLLVAMAITLLAHRLQPLAWDVARTVAHASGAGDAARPSPLSPPSSERPSPN